MQVKSILGRTTSKSPPKPTYLYVVSWMYSPCPVPTYARAPLPPPHPTPHAVHSSPAPTPQAPPPPPRAPPTKPPPGPPAMPP